MNKQNLKSNTTIRNRKLFCLNCGNEYDLKIPISIEEISKKIEAFNILHNDCEKTWKEPEIAIGDNLYEKAINWLTNGETGISSKTMVEVMIGIPALDNWVRDHPHDPDDFKRCYKLLKWIPELKPMLYKMKTVSKSWSNLVDNWEKITEMYEQNVREDWKNYKKIGMYEFMQTLII